MKIISNIHVAAEKKNVQGNYRTKSLKRREQNSFALLRAISSTTHRRERVIPRRDGVETMENLSRDQ